MNQPLKKWLQVSLFNLILIAFLGTLMRYKIAYSFPFVNQGNLLEAHEHFAFAGWITQALMSLLVHYLKENGDNDAFTRYRLLLFTNLFAAYGLLLTFPFMGYSLLSTAFSAIIILVSYWFAVKYWRDLNHFSPKNSSSSSSFKAAVLFNVLSSVGAFLIAYMFITKSIKPERYLATVYFYLHFQYNGWFFFACLGLMLHQLNKYGVSDQQLKKVFFLFVTACVPAYFLSALWLPIPLWVYASVVVAVLLQLTGWWFLIQVLRKDTRRIQKDISKLSKILFVLSAIALTAKLLLQSVSVIPLLSKLAFGFRPIVIGYLHLVLLGVITLFILSYITGMQLIPVNKMTRRGIIIFTAGIIINEFLLLAQGIADMNYKATPIINPLLFVAALILFSGITIIVYSQKFPGIEEVNISSEKQSDL
ncbi:MAG: hypothetical protein JST17_13955 [Bacteroidetes bacterium]|nr:hypothetical protein [Bacteroidota bacterium]MBS1930880.1 hypothetical protein [Bacteroidota bacterium]